MSLDYRLWHNGPVDDMNVFGSTAVLTRLSYQWDGSSTVGVPTAWRCG